MYKTDLINAIAQQHKALSKATLATVVETTLAVIQQELASGGRVTLIGFGSFATGKRAARRGRHPQTGEPLKIPAATTVKFTAGKALKERLNKRKRGQAKKQ